MTSTDIVSFPTYNPGELEKFQFPSPQDPQSIQESLVWNFILENKEENEDSPEQPALYPGDISLCYTKRIHSTIIPKGLES